MRSIGNLVLLSAAVAALGAMIWLYTSVERTARALILVVQQQEPAAVSEDALQAALFFVALDPHSLTVAGLAPVQVGTVAQDALTYLADHPSQLALAQAAVSAAKLDCDRLGRLVRSGMGTVEDVDAYAAAQANLELAEANCQSAANLLHEAATGSLPQPQRDVLATVRANQAWKLPVEYLTITFSEPQWVQLRDALAHERISERTGDTPDQDAAMYLASVRSDPAVAAAQIYLATTLGTNEAAWASATDQ